MSFFKKLKSQELSSFKESEDKEKTKNYKPSFTLPNGKWLPSQKTEAKLSIDLYETDAELVVQSTIAGIKAKDLDISVENDMLIIGGNREKPNEGLPTTRKYLYQECYWGSFCRKIILPEEIDPSRIEAIVKEGVLTIKIPKIQREGKKKIEIREEE